MTNGQNAQPACIGSGCNQIGIGHVGHAGAHQRVLNIEHLGDAGFHGLSVDQVGRVWQSNQYYINRDILISNVSM
jgi:hypothetical protein